MKPNELRRRLALLAYGLERDVTRIEAETRVEGCYDTASYIKQAGWFKGILLAMAAELRRISEGQ